MKTKLTQIQKNMMESAEKILDAFEKSGRATTLRSLSKIWTPEKIEELIDWKKNKRPKWKANKKIQQLLDDFLNSPPDGREHNDILTEIGKIAEGSRDKVITKPKTGQYGGASFNQQKKYIRISKDYERFKKTKSVTRARNMIMKKENISLSTFTRYLTYGNKLRQK